MFHDEERSTDTTGVRVNSDLSLPDISDHGYLRDDDIHLATKLPQGVHQLLWVTMDAHPTAVNKDLGGSVM